MTRYLVVFIAGCLLAATVAWLMAGGSAQGAPGPTGYTLADIHQFILSNGGTQPVETGHTLFPPGAPGQGGMPTLADVMAALRKRLPCPAGGGAGLQATGQTKCYDDGGNEINCASSDFPGQDGFYQLGCANQERFVDNHDGTVNDRLTGLIWQKERVPGTYTWQAALKYCEGLTLAGQNDWRLPNVRELHSIADYGRSNSASDPVFRLLGEGHWSSSTHDYWPQDAWGVEFSHGSCYFNDKSHSAHVRAVRSGPR